MRHTARGGSLSDRIRAYSRSVSNTGRGGPSGQDGRAEEAFIAVENSAFILTDETQRIEYDNSMREMRRNRRKEATTVQVFRRVFGPFCQAVFILGCIFI
jgi:hypothetical protein